MSRKKAPDRLAPREWSLLRHAWRRQRFVVGDLLSDLEAVGDPLAHTTVVTLLERTTAKGYIRRLDRQGHGFVYEVAVSYTDALRVEINHFLSTFLGDDPEALKIVRSELDARRKAK